MQIVEGLGGRVGRDGLGQEGVDLFLVLLKKRADLLGGVGTHRSGRPHHEARLLHDLLVGDLLHEIAGEVSGDGHPRAEHEDQYQSELY